MTIKSPLVLAVAASLAIPTIATSQSVRFEVIPQTATAMDLSPDGRFVVGASDVNGDGFPDGSYHLDLQTNTFTLLPAPGNDASAVSDDGQIVLGDMQHPVDGEVAGMYTLGESWMSLGFLPGAGMCPSRSNGYELSADGSVATGLSWDGCSGRAFRWTQATGMVEMEAIGPTSSGNRGSVISADGTVIAGFAQGTQNRTPAMWNGLTTLGMTLDPAATVVGEMTGISDDGEFILGAWSGDAVRWTPDDGPEVIGAGSIAANATGYAMDIADDGAIVGFDALFQTRTGWIKPRGKDELVRLDTYVISHGGTIPAGTALGIGTKISADGKTIVGHTFFQSAWKLSLCYGDADRDGDVDVDDLNEVIINWGTATDHPADFDCNGQVSVDDLVEVIINWGDCP